MRRGCAIASSGGAALAALAFLLHSTTSAQGITSAQTTQTLIESRTDTSAPSQRVVVEVFATSDTMITGAGDGLYAVQVFRVDAIRMLELELGRGLPPNEADAMPVVRARMKAMGASFAQRAQQGGAAVMGAQSYGLRSYPAMVFAGKAVVYGQSDVPTAARIFEAGRAQPLTRTRVNPTKLEAMGVRKAQP